MQDKSCNNCYWKTGNSCTYRKYPNQANVCEGHSFLCSQCNEQSEYRYNDEIYCADCLLKALDIERTEETVYLYYYLDGDYIANSNDSSIDDLLYDLGIDVEEIE